MLAEDLNMLEVDRNASDSNICNISLFSRNDASKLQLLLSDGVDAALFLMMAKHLHKRGNISNKIIVSFLVTWTTLVLYCKPVVVELAADTQ